jgi:protocatechuate 3,4-dioxygenase beta subunit
MGQDATCRDWVEQDQGPYHRNDEPFRRDVVEDRPGTPLTITIRLVRSDPAHPVPDAVVDIWHCDALGRYSGFVPPDTAHGTPSGDSEDFLRGRQRTDQTGSCEFRTIYPGWYRGRTVHVHVLATTRERAYISQLFFDDDITDQVHLQAPYDQRPGRDTSNASDDIFANNGASTMLQLSSDDDGLHGTICLIIDPQ